MKPKIPRRTNDDVFDPIEISKWTSRRYYPNRHSASQNLWTPGNQEGHQVPEGHRLPRIWPQDVVRHHLVQKIVDAYQATENESKTDIAA